MLGNIWKAHDSNSWLNNFINGIQIHNQSPWFETMAIYLSKPQFSLATSNAQLTLALLKAQANYMALFIKSPKLSILGEILYHNYFT